MTSPDPAAILAQINAAREQTYQNIALAQGILDQANASASSAAQDRAIVQSLVQQAVSVDTSVGTRVFAGDTLIYGDTGWRDISADLRNDWTGQVWIRRRGDNVTLLTHNLVRGSSVNALNLVRGFRSPVYGISGFHYGSPYPMGDGGSPSNVLGGYLHIAGSGYILRGYLGPDVTSLQGDASWTTPDPWPDSLPGTPW